MFLGLQGTNLPCAPVTVGCSVLHPCCWSECFWLAGWAVLVWQEGDSGADEGFARGAEQPELKITENVVAQPPWKSSSCSYAKGCFLPQGPV